MRKQVLDTQLRAWHEVQDKLPESRRTVLWYIAKSAHGRTLFELCNLTGWPVNRVSGRVTELRKAGLIEDRGERRINPESGKGAVVWYARLKGTPCPECGSTGELAGAIHKVIGEGENSIHMSGHCPTCLSRGKELWPASIRGDKKS